MSGFLRVELRTVEYHMTGVVDQIVLIGYDLHLRTDINSERDVKLARRMAESERLEFADLRDDEGAA